MRKEYRVRYAPNTRETVRRQVLYQLVLAGVTDLNPFDSRVSFKFQDRARAPDRRGARAELDAIRGAAAFARLKRENRRP